MPDNDNWKIIQNPEWVGTTPRGFTQSECHDKTFCLDVQCGCGFTMHVHESQIIGAEDLEICAECKGCRHILSFPPGYLHEAFAEMRRQGWIV